MSMSGTAVSNLRLGIVAWQVEVKAYYNRMVHTVALTSAHQKEHDGGFAAHSAPVEKW